MARAARSNFESSTEEFDTKRLAVMVGGGAAVVLAVVLIGFKLVGSKSEAPHPAPAPVAHAPQYPQEVTDLVAQTESALKADDFKAARANVDKLRQISPSHPRLAFFEGLLAQHANGPKSASAGSGAGGHGTSGASKRKGGTANAPITSALAATSAPAATPASPPPSRESGPAPSSATGAQDAPVLAPETPPGFSRASAASSETSHGDLSAATSANTSPAPAAAASAPPTPAEPSPPAHAASSSSSTPHRPSAGEPPPVIQEAKLVRRVTPDYPSAAKKDGIAGSVELEVTVSSRGVVENVAVLRANPPDIFEKSALAAVRKWKYEPRFVDGLPSEAHLKVHLEFGPNK